jgi:hypothetical protein
VYIGGHRVSFTVLAQLLLNAGQVNAFGKDSLCDKEYGDRDDERKHGARLDQRRLVVVQG